MTHPSSSSLAWHAQVSCSWWHIHSQRMHIVGVLYQALWEPVFTPSSGEHLSTVLRCWCSLLAWQEVVILFPYRFPNCACNRIINHLLFGSKERETRCCTNVVCVIVLVYWTEYFNSKFATKKYRRQAKVKWPEVLPLRKRANAGNQVSLKSPTKETQLRTRLFLAFLSNDSSKTLLPSEKKVSEVARFHLPSTHLPGFAFNISITGSYILL